MHWFSIWFMVGGIFFLTAGVILTASGNMPPGIGALVIGMSLLPLLVGWGVKACQLAGVAACRDDSSNAYLEKDGRFVIPKDNKTEGQTTKQVSKCICIFISETHRILIDKAEYYYESFIYETSLISGRYFEATRSRDFTSSEASPIIWARDEFELVLSFSTIFT